MVAVLFSRLRVKSLSSTLRCGLKVFSLKNCCWNLAKLLWQDRNKENLWHSFTKENLKVPELQVYRYVFIQNNCHMIKYTQMRWNLMSNVNVKLRQPFYQKLSTRIIYYNYHLKWLDTSASNYFTILLHYLLCVSWFIRTVSLRLCFIPYVNLSDCPCPNKFSNQLFYLQVFPCIRNPNWSD